MKLVSYLLDNKERTGIVLSDSIFDLEKALQEYSKAFELKKRIDCNDLVTILKDSEATPFIGKELSSFIETNYDVMMSYSLSYNHSKLAPPVRPGKCLAVGGVTVKGRPDTISFVKPMLKRGDAVVGNDDDIVIPRGIPQTHVSVELCLVIGKRIKNASLNESKSSIAGYTIGNDVAAISFHYLHGDLASTCKSLDTFAPIGPVLVGRDDVDTNDIELRLMINGHLQAVGNSGNSVFTPEKIVMDIASIMTLNPGDVIFCGNIEEMPLVHDGDVVECFASGIGVLRNRVKESNTVISDAYVNAFKKN
jgi:2-keto-4-pentenoate hydratase/2-oxohepta-3-ene-1,7-dioic acid hydratase in catechol pathway